MRLNKVTSTAVVAALSSFFSAGQARELYSNLPVKGAELLRDAYLIGNGKLGAIPFGQPGHEKLSLSHEALWSGGSFEDPAYRGGNPGSSTSANIKTIRDGVFKGGAGNIGGFGTSDAHYGSFRALANFSVQIEGIQSYNKYKRSLDLTSGAHTTTFAAQDQRIYTSVAYCSYPAQVCFYRLSVNTGKLPNVAFGLENQLAPPATLNLTCKSSYVRLTGSTLPENKGMAYDVMARLSTGALGTPVSSCSTVPGIMVVTGSAYGPSEPLTSISLVVGAQTEYDQTRCDAQNQFSCRGPKPERQNEKVTAAAATKLEPKMFLTHQADYQKAIGDFSLTLNDPWATSKYSSESLEFWQLMDRYRATSGFRPRSRGEAGSGPRWLQAPVSRQIDDDAWQPVEHDPDRLIPVQEGDSIFRGEQSDVLSAGMSSVPIRNETEQGASQRKMTRRQVERGDPPEIPGAGSYVESALFDYARHLLISSSRENSLPPNLQGVWTDTLETAWSGDYHTNINLEMNFGFADQVGITASQQALWRFIKDTWIPRGQETAKLVYNATGWVVHNELNIFGHTGMKNNATLANYPVAAAWMMQHVYDHYDYTRDVPFLQQTGYPFMRDVAKFWVSQLQDDKYTKDKSLVANPCNSPELGPTTFGCAHFQQLIHQLLDTTLSAAVAAGETDAAFTASLNRTLASLDKGFRIGTWGQIKEWKLPESKLPEKQAPNHRYLAQLVGWFPGYSIAALLGAYTSPAMQAAVAVTLRARGTGQTAITDAAAAAGAGGGDAAWPKLWRAAAWARLNNTAEADFHLRLAVAANFAQNGLSHVNGLAGPFQIDANLGLAGAMLAMLVVDLPAARAARGTRDVVLGPAIPRRWGPGAVKGLRIRGGTTLDMSWNAEGAIEKVSVTKRGEACRFWTKTGRLIGEI